MTGGYSKSLDRYYDLSVSVESAGGIRLREAYEYPERGDIEGREYKYSLVIPAAYVDTFLIRLAQAAQLEPTPPQERKIEYLITLLKRLIQQGALASVETARAQENLDTFKSWLKQDNIPYEEHNWVW